MADKYAKDELNNSGGPGVPVRQAGSGIEIKHTGNPVHFKRETVQAEIVFVVDTTGSMSDKISGLMQTCRKFAEEAVSRQIVCRMGILCFGDLTIDPPLDPDMRGRTMNQAIAACRERDITCFAVTTPNARFRTLAAETGGEWFSISSGVDFLGILDRLFPRVIERIQEISLQLPSGIPGKHLPGSRRR